MGLIRKLREIHQIDYFEQHMPHVDTTKWPGREWKFLYCHPLIAILIFFCVISEIIILLIWGTKGP